jgi:hypothetical protein
VKPELLLRFPARKVRLGRKATREIPEILGQLLLFLGLKVIPAILARKEFKEFPAKLARQARQEPQERPGQPGLKETKAILATLGQPEPQVRPAQLAQPGHKEFKGSKATPEIQELFPQLLPLLTTRKLGLYLYLLQLSQ